MSTEQYPEQNPIQIPTGEKSYTILLVEDDQDDTEFIRDAIHYIVPAATICCFPNAAQLLQHLRERDGQNPITLFVFDYNLPITTGLELLKIVHSDAKYRSIPKVMYSNSDRQKDRESCLSAGAVAYVKKSNSFEQIRMDALQMLSVCYPDN